MAASIIDGPLFRYGNMAAILASVFGSPVGDYNSDAGPGGVFQGEGFLDPRYYFGKDQVQGNTGKVPMHFQIPAVRSIHQIPAAAAVNNIAAAANVTSGTAMTLAGASVGVTPNIPIVAFNAGGITAGTVTTPALMLDFGFAFGTVVAASKSVVVADSSNFVVGMPLVIAGVGNAGGTVPLLTNVASIVDTTHITIQDAPLASLNPAAIGTGNIWGPSSTLSTNSFVTPTAHLPWFAAGPGLLLDGRQAVARGVRIVGAASGTGGNFTVRGHDIYNQPMSEIIAVGAGAVTGWGVKAFKDIVSVTPAFTDAHNYSVGTSDVFGFHYRAGVWEDVEVSWNATQMTATQGYTAPLALITTPTATTADLRGTIQTSALGGGTGIGATASNGSVSALAMSGVRLMMQQNIFVVSAIMANPANAATVFGATQFTS